MVGIRTLSPASAPKRIDVGPTVKMLMKKATIAASTHERPEADVCLGRRLEYGWPRAARRKPTGCWPQRAARTAKVGHNEWMLPLDVFFDDLWTDFVRIAPAAAKIKTAFEERGETVHNDHVAFRTFDRGPLALEQMEPLILGLGYELLDEYHFEDKKLRARAYLRPGAPRIFLSELLVSERSDFARELIDECLRQVPPEASAHAKVFCAGRLWAPIRHRDYQRLAEESEYAAWLCALGLHANHFTVSVNDLVRFDSIGSVLDFVEDSGYAINESGGRIKGSPEVALEQGSTMADRMPTQFAEGEFTIPTCYYEFALRYRDASGQLYNGFVTKSADKIFESTHR